MPLRSLGSILMRKEVVYFGISCFLRDREGETVIGIIMKYPYIHPHSEKNEWGDGSLVVGSCLT